MSKSHVIEWKSQVNGRTGRGTKFFEQEEAQRLADELNREYPAILHHAVEAPLPAGTAPSPAEANQSEEPAAASRDPELTESRAYAFTLK